jgi:hypothetical protein
MDVVNVVGAPIRDWRATLNQFAIVFGNKRVPLI